MKILWIVSFLHSCIFHFSISVSSSFSRNIWTAIWMSDAETLLYAQNFHFCPHRMRCEQIKQIVKWIYIQIIVRSPEKYVKFLWKWSIPDFFFCEGHSPKRRAIVKNVKLFGVVIVDINSQLALIVARFTKLLRFSLDTSFHFPRCLLIVVGISSVKQALEECYWQWFFY